MLLLPQIRRPNPTAPWKGGARRRAIALVLTVALLGRAVSSEAASLPRGQMATQEYDLKAVLLYNFTQFVTWPPDAFAGPDDPWVIGVLGRDPFGKVLDDVMRSESHQNRRIVVERYHDASEIRRCHILFVGGTEGDELSRTLAVLKNRPILSVGEFDSFADRGGMIHFMKTPEGKIRLRINLRAVKEGSLSISAKLLRVSEVIENQEN